MAYTKYTQRDCRFIMANTSKELHGKQVHKLDSCRKIGYASSIYGCKYEVFDIIHNGRIETVVTDPYAETVLTR